VRQDRIGKLSRERSLRSRRHESPEQASIRRTNELIDTSRKHRTQLYFHVAAWKKNEDPQRMHADDDCRFARRSKPPWRAAMLRLCSTKKRLCIRMKLINTKDRRHAPRRADA